MNEGEIAERLIMAAEIDRFSGGKIGPQQPRSIPLPYAFSQADKNGWGTERLAEERKAFFDSLSRQPTARQVTEAEEAWGWLALVENEKIGTPSRAGRGVWPAGAILRTGAFDEDSILRPVGVEKIAQSHVFHALSFGSRCRVTRMQVFGCCLIPPETSDIDANIEAEATAAKRSYSWAADEAFTSYFSNDPTSYGPKNEMPGAASKRRSAGSRNRRLRQ